MSYDTLYKLVNNKLINKLLNNKLINKLIIEKSWGVLVLKMTYIIFVIVSFYSFFLAIYVIDEEGENSLLNKNIGVMLPFVLAMFSLNISIIINNLKALTETKYYNELKTELLIAILCCSFIELFSIFLAIMFYVKPFKNVPYFIGYLVHKGYLSINFLNSENLKLFFIDVFIIFSLLFMMYMITLWLITLLLLQTKKIILEAKKEMAIEFKEEIKKEEDQSTPEKEKSAVNIKSNTQKRKRKKTKKR